jgi:Icc-related predicted phosphoesterase
MKKNQLRKVLLIPDTHVPYHDKKAFELVLNVGKGLKVDEVVIGGDFIDNYSVSSHDKNPNRARKLDEEVESTIKELKRVKEIGAKKNVYIAGNHEDRLERYLMKTAPELYNIISTEKILQLKELGFKYVPYKHIYEIGKLSITHDLGKAGRTAHLKALDDYQNNIVIFHTHRLGYAIEGNVSGTKHVGTMLGWLGDVDSVDYKHKALAQKEWALGFGVAYHDTNTDNVYVVPVPIVNYTCLVEGKLYKVK